MPLNIQEHQQAIVKQIWRLRAKFPVYAYEKYRIHVLQERGKDFPLGSYESTIQESMSARYCDGWVSNDFSVIIQALDALEQEHHYECRETYQQFLDQYRQRMKNASNPAEEEMAWRDSVNSIHRLHLTEDAEELRRRGPPKEMPEWTNKKRRYAKFFLEHSADVTASPLKTALAFTLLGCGMVFLTLAIQWELNPSSLPLPENITAARHKKNDGVINSGSGVLLPDKPLTPPEMEEEKQYKEKLKAEVPIVPLTTSPEPNRFSDLSGSSAVVLAANKLATRGIIAGYPDGTFRPNATIIRAEIIKILVLARFGWQISNNVSTLFTDVSTDDWFNQYMDTAAKYAIVSTRNGTMFYPAKEVNTAEFISMVGIAFDLPVNERYQYKDVDPRRGFARYAGAVQRLKLLPRHPELLEPAKPITRGEAAMAILSLLVQGNSEKRDAALESSDARGN